MKCIVTNSPYVFISLLGLILVTLSGLCLRVFERTIEGNEFEYVWNGFWVILITETTVGYGEITPMSHLGRCICIISALFGTFLMSFSVLITHNSTSLTTDELKLYDDFKYKVVLNHNLRMFGIKLIQRWWRLMIQRRKKQPRLQFVFKFKQQKSLFKLKRFIYKSEQSISLSDSIEHTMNTASKSCSDLHNHLKVSKHLENTGATIVKDEFSILQKLKSIQKFLGADVKESNHLHSTGGSFISSARPSGILSPDFRRSSQRSKFESFRNILKKISPSKEFSQSRRSSILTVDSQGTKDTVFTIKISSFD